jgi:hypothetical protein
MGFVTGLPFVQKLGSALLGALSLAMLVGGVFLMRVVPPEGRYSEVIAAGGFAPALLTGLGAIGLLVLPTARAWAIPMGLLSVVLLAFGAAFWLTSLHGEAFAVVYAAPSFFVGVAAIGVLISPDRLKAFAAMGVVGVILPVSIVIAFDHSQTLQYHTALAYYNAPEKSGRHGNLAAHFPKSIPADAKDVFIHADGDLSASIRVFEFSYSTSEENIEAIEKTFERQAIDIYQGTSRWSVIDQGYQLNCPPVTFCPAGCEGTAGVSPGLRVASTTGAGARVDLPADYRVMLLKFNGQGASCGIAQGDACGIAISQKRGRVIFWAARWFIS